MLRLLLTFAITCVPPLSNAKPIDQSRISTVFFDIDFHSYHWSSDLISRAKSPSISLARSRGILKTIGINPSLSKVSEAISGSTKELLNSFAFPFSKVTVANFFSSKSMMSTGGIFSIIGLPIIETVYFFSGSRPRIIKASQKKTSLEYIFLPNSSSIS